MTWVKNVIPEYCTMFLNSLHSETPMKELLEVVRQSDDTIAHGRH